MTAANVGTVGAYVAVTAEGMVQEVVVDDPKRPEDTMEALCEFVRDGLRIERVTLEQARLMLYEPFKRPIDAYAVALEEALVHVTDVDDYQPHSCNECAQIKALLQGIYEKRLKGATTNTEFQMNSMSYAEARAAVEAFNQYPNLQAILEGRVAGKLIEWPAIRPELKRLALQLAGNTRHEICRDSPDPRTLTITDRRTPSATYADYAVEHADYLADQATMLLEICNERDAAMLELEDALDVEGPDCASGCRLALENATTAYSESMKSLRDAVYEFEKRRDRALQAGKCENGVEPHQPPSDDPTDLIRALALIANLAMPRATSVQREIHTIAIKAIESRVPGAAEMRAAGNTAHSQCRNQEGK